MIQKPQESDLLLSRKQWSSACRFHERTAEQLLDEILQRAQGRVRPLILFDLDSTLYEVRSRTYRIIQDWTETAESSSVPGFRDWLRELCETQVRYSVPETLEEAFRQVLLGLRDCPEVSDLSPERRGELVSQIHQFWFQRFFTNDYLIHDRVYPGAVDFVQSVYQSGAEIVYLTGRDRPNMGRGTVENLIRDRFPWDLERTHLLMKPQFDLPDLDFKLGASQEFCSSGHLVASFENEPPNVVALYRLFPKAMHVFVDTVCGNQVAQPCAGLYRLDSWKKISKPADSC